MSAQPADPTVIQHTALIRVVRNVIKGEEPPVDIATKMGQLVKGDAQVVGQELTNFVGQFLSDFGTQALAKAEPLAEQIITGSTSMTAAGNQLLTELAPLAITDAEKDGTVALNAIRVQLTSKTVTQPPAAAAANSGTGA